MNLTGSLTTAFAHGGNGFFYRRLDGVLDAIPQYIVPLNSLAKSSAKWVLNGLVLYQI